MTVAGRGNWRELRLTMVRTPKCASEQEYQDWSPMRCRRHRGRGRAVKLRHLPRNRPPGDIEHFYHLDCTDGYAFISHSAGNRRQLEEETQPNTLPVPRCHQLPPRLLRT